MSSSLQTFFNNESPRRYVERDVQLNDFPEKIGHLETEEFLFVTSWETSKNWKIASVPHFRFRDFFFALRSHQLKKLLMIFKNSSRQEIFK